MIPLIEQAGKYLDRHAIISNQRTYSYSDLINRSKEIAKVLLSEKSDLEEDCVAFMVRPSFDYVSTLWGIWLAGGIAVPVCIQYPDPAIEYVIINGGVRMFIADGVYGQKVRELCKPLDVNTISLSDLSVPHDKILPEISPNRRAMILYTSGTTSNPKGVVSRHKNISAQISSLVKSWHWVKEDKILNILPLHHVHGIINVLCCALWSGACCEFLPKFDEQQVFERFINGEFSLFMAVPTIYYKLIQHWGKLNQKEKNRFSRACLKFRLMVSGSAALPISVLNHWEKITGQRLLERYGMTEIGMALSNPYQGERRPAHVGLPLPGVQVRLVDELDQDIPEGEPGEIQVRGPNVFEEYWKNPAATGASFTTDGWFKTGDMALISNEYFKILGRKSIDIIKTGGFKVSALEIEDVLLQHSQIKECAVVGLPDPEWGELIGACIVANEESIAPEQIKEWLLSFLPKYKIPRKYLFSSELPRNALGKVLKPQVKSLFGF